MRVKEYNFMFQKPKSHNPALELNLIPTAAKLLLGQSAKRLGPGLADG